MSDRLGSAERLMHDRQTILREAAGLWSDVTDRPNFSALRAEMDRHQMGEHY